MIKHIGYGAALWLVLFILVSIVLVVPGSAIGRDILKIVIVAAAAFGLAWYEFRKRPVDLKTGLTDGAIWAATVVVLDWILIGIAIGMQQPDATLRASYFSWAQYVSLLAIIAAAGWVAKGKPGMMSMNKTTSPFKSEQNKSPMAVPPIAKNVPMTTPKSTGKMMK